MENLLRKRLALIKARAREFRPAHGSPTAAEAPRTLAEAAPGDERSLGEERFYLVRRRGAEIAPDAEAVAKRFLDIPGRRSWPLSSLIQDPGPDMAARIRAGEVCFLDIETTGLTPNTYVFLCGLLFVDGSELVVEQPFARDYAEERAILLYLRETMDRYPMVVTFNGANFDIPFIETRMTVARIKGGRRYQHVDLLDAARRAFAGTLANCRLETVERHLRGVARSGDIPGGEIPGAYHDFVRTGNARAIGRILYHNRMDLLAMVYLVNYLAAPGAARE
ncbi:MAG: ribonuclease H-like domain-containing protein [Candidatus Krumholzibacteriia bacterium]